MARDRIVRSVAAVSRRLTAVRYQRTRLRHLVPGWLPRRYTQARSKATEWRHLWIRVAHRSRLTNVYHCCVHKTGSQWLKAMFLDPQTYRWSGLSYYHYQSRTGTGDVEILTERTYPRPVPPGSIVSPVYVSYENYLAMPKNGPHRAIFVTRDPRDLVVSWYFSVLRSHVVRGREVGPLAAMRAELAALDRSAGLRYAVDHLSERGRFATLQSWAGADADPGVMLVRYEDLVSDRGQEVFATIFEFFDIAMPPEVLSELVSAYSFERVSGRHPGDEDPSSHLRSATAGGWRAHFDDEVADHFARAAGPLVSLLGYEPR